jgi:WD40 repeat protein
LQSISYDINTNKLYVGLQSINQIFIFKASNNESTFTLISNIYTQNLISSVLFYQDKIYVGSSLNRISIYNETNNSLISIIYRPCPSDFDYINSIKVDCNGNLIYLCGDSLIAKVKNENGTDMSISLTNYFGYVGDIYIDSKNRFWIGGDGLVIYN